VLKKSKSDEIQRMLMACRGYFITAALFSLAINLLYLASPLYMLQVYDRVISSASHLTLVMLTIALLVAFVALAGLDAVRARILTRASVRLDRLMAPRIMTAIVERAQESGARSQFLRDFDTFRQFVTGHGIHAIFDLPWAPIYIGVIVMLHPLLGAFAFGCAVILVCMALLNEWAVRAPLGEANEASTRNYGFTEMSLRNTEVIRALGMTDGLLRRWSRDRYRMLERQVAASDRAAVIQSVIRFLRLSMQSLILGLGAYLVIERAVTVGAMFAASLLLGRALQPVEQIVGSWRNLVSARTAYHRVRDLLTAHPPQESRLSLPRPSGKMQVDNLTCIVSGVTRPILRGVTFKIEPGDVLGVIGPSGSGKSTLARHMVGVLAPYAGSVRLDGADVCQWPSGSRGQHIGYLPQDIELFADTVANNISRFQSGDDGEIIKAAQLAGLHELILQLPNGYETHVGEGGAVLSGGFRQRIGLARAVYGNPSIVVLDEPNSNLDADGDAALAECIMRLKSRGTSIVMVSHRPSALNVVDKLLVIREGVVELFGPRADVLQRLTRPVPTANVPAAVSS
jgi:ATP-binding cassette, subfamily C, type I secretion system permease/ATPase